MTTAVDGSKNITVVNGSTYVGAYAADGSTNVVQVSGSTLVGQTHPSGAMNVVNTSVTPSTTGLHHPCGASNVKISPGGAQVGAFAADGSYLVTVVSGALT